MTASENTSKSKSGTTVRGGSQTAAGNGAAGERTTHGSHSPRNGSGNGGEPAKALTVLPAPLAEKTLAATRAVRETLGDGGGLRAALSNRKSLAAGGTSAISVAAVTGAYFLGRRAGLRRRGPLSRLTGGRI